MAKPSNWQITIFYPFLKSGMLDAEVSFPFTPSTDISENIYIKIKVIGTPSAIQCFP